MVPTPQQRGGSGEVVVLRDYVWGSNIRGTYRGSVGTETPGILWGKYQRKPEGHGDFDGEDENAGWAYSGEWRGGVPCGVGWRLKEGCVYAGESDGAGRRHGHGTYWSGDGRRCFEGEWRAGFPHGEGVMLREDGELWRVRFDGWTRLWPSDGWDRAVRVAMMGRVLAGGPAPVARREERGAAAEWLATVALPDGRKVWRRFRGLTQVK